MTDRALKQQQCWQIQVPVEKLPEPKFYFTRQVGSPWEDEQGNSYYYIGEIIGMQYCSWDNQPAQWSYRLRVLKCDYDPSLVGLEEEDFIPESLLVADDTVI